MGLRWFKTSRVVQERPRWLKIAAKMPPRGLKTAPRRFQVTTEFRAETHETPESLNNQKKIVMFALSSFRSLPSGHFRHKTDRTLPKRAPRGAQNGPRTAPRAPNSSRDGSKRAPGEPEEAQGGPETATEGARRVRTPEDGPKSARDARRFPEKLP